jgi:hypothetical protein
VSRIELKRSSRTLGAAEVGGADVVDDVAVVDAGLDVAVDVAGVDECDEHPARATAAPTPANLRQATGIRFGK